MFYEVLGVIGTAILTGCALPQILKAHRTRSTGDLSLGYLGSLLTGMVLLLFYAAYLENALFISGQVIGIALTGVLLGMALKWR